MTGFAAIPVSFCLNQMIAQWLSWDEVDEQKLSTQPIQASGDYCWA
jgi:hypothetical protein